MNAARTHRWSYRWMRPSRHQLTYSPFLLSCADRRKGRVYVLIPSFQDLGLVLPDHDEAVFRPSIGWDPGVPGSESSLGARSRRRSSWSSLLVRISRLEVLFSSGRGAAAKATSPPAARRWRLLDRRAGGVHGKMYRHRGSLRHPSTASTVGLRPLREARRLAGEPWEQRAWASFSRAVIGLGRSPRSAP